MKIRWQVVDSVLCVRIDGDLDLYGAEEFRRQVDHALQSSQARDLVVNMASVAFVDSSGLGAILGRYRRVSQCRGRMILAGLKARVRPMLEISGIQRIIPVASSEGEALDMLKGGAGIGA
ncbi:MAG: anti-sigma factor antagonist [Bacillota bacterium]